MKRTKIIATLGPATDKPGMLEKLFELGVDVFRLNYSHQTHKEHEERVRRIREVSRALNHTAGIIGDLQGPKIRIEHFRNGSVQLHEGADFVIDTELDSEAGDEHQVGVSYKLLPQDVHPGNALSLDDGRIVLSIQKINGSKVICKVVTGGTLSNNKGLNLQNGGLSVGALTDKDRADLLHAGQIGVDFIAASFVRNADDIREVRRLIEENNFLCHIIAKIERREALENIEEIIAESNAIMIARGDLGVEIGYSALPPTQKKLINLAREMDRAVITATQMMESMIDQQTPTRAEVFDVAHAVLEGTDAVMLSAETSVGNYPDLAVKHMAIICEETEKQHTARTSHHRINQNFESIEEAVAMSTMYAANHCNAQAIVAVTQSGGTCLWMSRISSGLPIYAFTHSESTRRRVTLYRGVYPVNFDVSLAPRDKIYDEIINALREKKLLKKDDLVVITIGDHYEMQGTTNSMKIVQV